MDKCENCKNCNIANRREVVFFIVFLAMWLLPFVGYRLGREDYRNCATPTPMIETMEEQQW